MDKIWLNRAKRQKRVRSKIRGTSGRPRLTVFRSNKQIYSQLIDDRQGRTLAAASGKDPEAAGKALAAAAKKKKITQAVFDRGRYRFHGRVKALAESCRAAGLIFLYVLYVL